MPALAPWISAYRPEWRRPDILAGVSVAAVAIPIAIAQSQLAGVPPVYGLHAGLCRWWRTRSWAPHAS